LVLFCVPPPNTHIHACARRLDTPENAEQREALGDDPALQPCKFLRVGEHPYSRISELKQRVWELTRLEKVKQHLFFQCAAENGGRRIRELRGWREDWPW
jgi:hypothetical protein